MDFITAIEKKLGRTIDAGDVSDLVEDLGYKPATPIQEICILNFLDGSRK